MATTPHHLNPRGARRAVLVALVAALCATSPAAAFGRAAEPPRLGPPCFPGTARPPLTTTDLPAREAEAARPAAYGWPLRPFDRQHPIRAHFNDPREGHHGSRQFHFGIDISAPNGTAVYAVAPGTVYLSGPKAVAVRAADRRRVFAYWHIVPVVRELQQVERHQLLGHIEAPWAHVHFAESVDGEYLNPLRPGALGPFRDTTVPRIADVRLVRSGRPLDPARASGSVDLVADAYDAVPLPVRRPWSRMPVTPAGLRWRVLSAGGAPVLPWRAGPALGGRFRRPQEFRAVYARGTRQNHPHRPGRYCIVLARSWQMGALAPGRYALEVEAADLAGNRSRARLSLTVGGRRETGR